MREKKRKKFQERYITKEKTLQISRKKQFENQSTTIRPTDDLAASINKRRFWNTIRQNIKEIFSCSKFQAEYNPVSEKMEF